MDLIQSIESNIVILSSLDFDNWMNIAVVLFVLSLVSERLTNFVKLYFPETNTRWNNLTNTRFFNVKTKSDNEQVEKLRERRIQWISVACGIIVAFVMDASLFELLSNGAFEAFSDVAKDDPKKGYDISSLPGCILTGLFISMGSKFWHDLIDLLLYAKNAKQTLSDPNTFNKKEVNQIRKWIDTSKDEIYKEVFSREKDKLSKVKGVIGLSLEYSHQKGYYIEVEHLEIEYPELPDVLEYMDDEIGTVAIPIQLKPSSMTEFHWISPSDIVRNASNPGNEGVLAVPVCRRNDYNTPLFLSCYHVLKGLNHDLPSIDLSREIEIEDSMGRIIGKLVGATFNKYVDAALLKPDTNQQVFTETPEGFSFSLAPKEDFKNHQEVIIFGRKKRKSEGQIVSTGVSQLIGGQFLFHNLIRIKGSSHRFSLPGDSGAALIDQYGQVYGMLIAGDAKFSYAIPIDSILKSMNLKLYQG